jgi:CHASE2 domain-containing sensor protein
LFSFTQVKLKSFKPIPVFIAAITIGLAAFFQSPFFIQHFNLFQHSELLTYDQRVRFSNRFQHPVATNLAFVKLDEVTIKILPESWPYPRQMHGRLVRELTTQGARAIAFDVLLGELRPYDSPRPAPR